MSIQIDTVGAIILDGKDTGLGVTQRREGTVVYTREKAGYRGPNVVRDPVGRNEAGIMQWEEKVVQANRPGVRYAEHKMPHARYLLGSDSPITKPGVATRAQFEADIRALLVSLS